jgi:hypothetical protein
MTFTLVSAGSTPQTDVRELRRHRQSRPQQLLPGHRQIEVLDFNLTENAETHRFKVKSAGYGSMAQRSSCCSRGEAEADQSVCTSTLQTDFYSPVELVMPRKGHLGKFLSNEFGELGGTRSN